MKMKIAQTIIILAVLAASFFAIYLLKPLEKEILPPIPQSKNIEKPIEHREEDAKPVEDLKQNEAFIQAKKATFILPIDTNKPSFFGVLGEGRGDEASNESISTTVLSQLFEGLKTWQVQAVFFTGNLVSGVERTNNEEKELTPISEEVLEKDLVQFSELYKSILGKDVPFYPALGDREIAISNGAEKFINQFHLKGATLLKDELLYTVSAGRAFFAVIATDELNEGRKSEQTFSSEMLEWLEGALKEAAQSHEYLFVVGYEPAFPSTSTFSKAHTSQRDAFWKILVENKVLAYFSSKEHLFDRSNRSGVWQIISGGGGAPLSQGGGSKPFYHSLLLTIPAENEKAKNPVIQVIDSRGKMVDEFILNSDNQPLYQMRISRN